MRKILLSLTVALISFPTASAFAEGIGTSVTGQMLVNGNPPNYFNSANGYVPAGYGNSSGSTTVTIGSGIEFGFADGANTDTADFTGTTLTLQDVTSTNSVVVDYIFTDPFFSSFSLVSNSLGATYSVTGDTIEIFGPQILSAGTRSIVLSFSSAVAPTPEPSSLILLGTGALGIVGSLRRRLLA